MSHVFSTRGPLEKTAKVRYYIGSSDVVVAQHHRPSEYVETNEDMLTRLVMRVRSVYE